METAEAHLQQERLLQDEQYAASQRQEAQSLRSKIRWRTNHLIALYAVNVALLLTLLWALTHVRTHDPQLEIYCMLFTLIVLSENLLLHEFA